MSKAIETAVVKTSEIVVAEGFNPRKRFDEDSLAELAESIKETGITTALTVRRENGNYQLVDGERRLRAAKLAGLKQVPVLIRGGDADVAALVANIQREDLDPIEEATQIAEIKQHSGLSTNKAVAEKIGKPVEFVAGRLRLLALPEGCHQAIADGEVTIAAEPVLRKVAKVSPEAAVAMSELVAAGELPASRLVDAPDEVLRRVALRGEGTYLVDLSRGGVHLSELAPEGSAAEALWERAIACESCRDYNGEVYLRLEEGDYDRLRASGKLIEIESGDEYISDQVFLADSELGIDLASQLVDRVERAEEEARAEQAKAAGIASPDGKAPEAEEIAKAEREERRKERAAKERRKLKAEAFNSELAGSLLNRRGAKARKAHRLNRAKVLARRVVADNPELAGAGMRLVFPQLREVEAKTLKSGEQREKVSYADAERCREYLLDQVDRAKSVDEVLEIITDALLCTALADEEAIAPSNRISWWAGTTNQPASVLADEVKEAKPKRTKKRA